MAKQTLPTNFVDDILASSMGGKRKFTITDNGDGTYSLEDVTEYTQTGSDFGAGQINATNQAVNESCDKANVIETMDDIVANHASGMIAGAKAVAELNGKFKIIAQKKTKDNRINVSAGQKATSYIIIDAIDGYTPVLATVWSSHVTTTTSDARIVGDRVMFHFDAASNQTPETFTADILYIKDILL